MLDLNREIQQLLHTLLDLQTPELLLTGEVDDKMAEYVRLALAQLRIKGNPNLIVRITTNGGSSYCGLNIYDNLRAYSGNTTAIVDQRCHSAGVIILQGCTTRQALRHSSIGLHTVGSGKVLLSTLENTSQRRAFIADLRKTEGYVEEILCRRTRLSLARIRQLNAKQVELRAPEALKLRLIDTVI